MIKFSERPYRLVKYITVDQLKNLWSKGINSFESDPPNAVLMAKGHNAQIIVLMGITVNKETISFHVHLTNPAAGLLKKGSLENISLVVDPIGFQARSNESGHIHTYTAHCKVLGALWGTCDTSQPK